MSKFSRQVFPCIVVLCFCMYAQRIYRKGVMYVALYMLRRHPMRVHIHTKTVDMYYYTMQ